MLMLPRALLRSSLPRGVAAMTNARCGLSMPQHTLSGMRGGITHVTALNGFDSTLAGRDGVRAFSTEVTSHSTSPPVRATAKLCAE